MLVPKSFAHAIVFHALIHHGVAQGELEAAVRYVAPHGDDWPENVRWPATWAAGVAVYEWPRTGMRL